MNSRPSDADALRRVEERLREALRAEADRHAAAEPPGLAGRCAAAVRAEPPSAWNARRSTWIAAAAAVAAGWLLIVRLTAPPATPMPSASLARAATAAELARLYAALPRLPPVVRPPAPPRLVPVRPPPVHP